MTAREPSRAASLGEDILPEIRGSPAPAILNFVLGLLTHPSHLLRRFAFLLILLTYFLTLRTLFSIRSWNQHHRSRHASSAAELALEEAALTRYTPVAQTPAQEKEYERLLSMIEERSSAYNTALFRDEAMIESEINEKGIKVVGVTAVVLHWKRRKGLQLVVKHISRYPFIREIIVWNNIPGVDLMEEEFEISTPTGLDPPILRIYNSPANIHDAGKHHACSLATYDHCYFNDDDWLNIYMDSLYSNYLDCCSGTGVNAKDGRIASNTLPIIHLEHRRWRFDNPDLQLRTGFTWLGTGSFAPKSLSVRFLNQQSAAPVLLTKEQTLLSDMFFSLWTNTYPEQMPNDLVPIDVEGGEDGWSRGSGVDQWAVVYANILDAIRKLYDVLLESETHLTPTPFSLSPSNARLPESHNRAPCANDGCLFSTSLSPFPDASQIKYPPPRAAKGWSLFGSRNKASKRVNVASRGTRTVSGNPRRERFEEELVGPRGFDPWEIDSVKEHEVRWNEAADGEKGWPEDRWWIEKGSWHLAVDGKGEETCWESWQAPKVGDHFGLTLVEPLSVHVVKITGSHDLSDIGNSRSSWEIFTVSEITGREHPLWIPRTVLARPKSKRLGSKKYVSSIRLKPLLDENERGTKIQKIKFVALKQGPENSKLRVCGFELDAWQI